MSLVSESPAVLTPPALGQLWPGQGGQYVATVPAMLGRPARHIISGTEEVRLAYGPYDHDVKGAGSHVDGRANTAALIADKKKHPAAQWCAAYTADGHKDFFLGSRFDWLMAYLQAPQCFEQDDYYLTSSQGSRLTAFVQDFEYGTSYWGTKASERRVRAFRQILLNA